MPNWVFNHLSVEGSEREVAKLKAQVGVAITTNYENKEEVNEKCIFSFMNILPPPADKLDEYYGTHGFADGKKTGDTEYNWYVFNNREWGTKWDANDVELLEDNKTSLHYKFDTAWSPPTPVIKELSRQYPELTITLSYEEESEWGGEIEYLAGEEVNVTEYDSPSSHEDYVDRDREDSCVCGHEEDKSEWYDDCPGAKGKEINLFAVKDLEIIK
jgi:hypothetical protein